MRVLSSSSVNKKMQNKEFDFSEVEINNYPFFNCSALKGKVNFNSSVLKSCDFRGLYLNKCIFKNTVFINCNFTLTNFFMCSFINCKFIECCQMINCYSNCCFNNCAFEADSFVNASVINCTIKNSLFSNMKILNITSKNTVINDTVWKKIEISPASNFDYQSVTIIKNSISYQSDLIFKLILVKEILSENEGEV